MPASTRRTSSMMAWCRVLLVHVMRCSASAWLACIAAVSATSLSSSSRSLTPLRLASLASSSSRSRRPPRPGGSDPGGAPLGAAKTAAWRSGSAALQRWNVASTVSSLAWRRRCSTLAALAISRRRSSSRASLAAICAANVLSWPANWLVEPSCCSTASTRAQIEVSRASRCCSFAVTSGVGEVGGTALAGVLCRGSRAEEARTGLRVFSRRGIW